MSDKITDLKDNINIPILNGTNYSEWYRRTKIYLRSKDLLDVCLNSMPAEATPAAINKWKKASCNAVSFISSKIDPSVFIEVVDDETMEDAHLLWEKINEQYASKTAINCGRVVMNWVRLVYYCANGVHNPLNTSHKPNQCYVEFPHLRPKRKNNKDNQSSSSPSTHLSTAHALMTCTPKSLCEIIIDSVATHHMFNDKSLFTSLELCPPFVISTGDPARNLCSEGKGSVSHSISGKLLSLKNCLYIPRISHNLISIIQLLEESITIEKLTEERFKIIINCETTLYGQIINGLMSVTHNAPITLMSVGDVWHPSNQVARTLGLPPSSNTCETCILGKLVLLPFSSNFEKIKKLVSDKGSEFENKSFSTLATSCGFVHLFPPTSTPEHNGFAKRANRTILDKARCLLLTSCLPRSYWAEAVNTASFLSNLAPTPSRDNLSPYSMWSSKPSRIKRLKTFGCKAFIFVHKNKREWKLSPRSEEGILLGFVNNNSAYRILHLRDKVVVITRHALFAEDKFPSLDYKPNVPTCSRWVEISQEDDETFFNCEEVEPEDVDVVNFSDQINETSPPAGQPELPEDVQNILPYSQRPKTFIASSAVAPASYSRAISGNESLLWTDAIRKELDAMKKLEVWDVIPLRDDLKLVGTTWVFKRKHNAKHEVTEYKARLCAQGFLQTFGQDYSKAFVPTGCLHSLQALILHSVKEKLDFQQLDIRSAFLNASLDEDVYLSVPQGLPVCKRQYCLKLKKAIYGLKQAPLAWYKRLTTWLTCSGFTASVSDPCVFFRKAAPPIWLFFHVDNIAVFRSEISSFKEEIKAEFDVKDLGKADLMLGIKLNHIDDGLIMSSRC
ncbi:hypothetical protein O181_083653 [Austropuccinia psidii MF-1]|uniref:Integrase catalytic domain-containing protein n=1 Tax=Austropuccinia psidii MF-1 TaxID=1389203 RepID=A0A9Q3IJS2_9BASI|nr:hypothetical protein [Austropuccinia psidii MF-1]